jgi:glycosyltransferase involved in cell wall biosynthesis
MLKDFYESFYINIKRGRVEKMKQGTRLKIIHEFIHRDKRTDRKILVVGCGLEGFKKEIIRLLNNDELRKEYGERARQLVIENFSWSKIIREYLDVFKEAQ